MTRLEYERRQRRWNQTELAYHSRLTQGEISRLERRLMVLTHTYGERIGRALGVRPETLLDEVRPDEPRVEQPAEASA